jgi:Cu+-exporting ATPase
MIGLGEAIWVISAILIVACPCALALSAPFAFGNMLRRFGLDNFYLKNAQVLEEMPNIDTIIFDKTGTLTEQSKYKLFFQNNNLKRKEKQIAKSMAKASNHPLSRFIYAYFSAEESFELENLLEIAGKGLMANFQGDEYRLGSASFVKTESKDAKTKVYFARNEDILEVFIFEAEYREGMKEVFESLNKTYELSVLSGDNDNEKDRLEKILPDGVVLRFNQSVHDKTDYIEKLQAKGKRVMMIGHGLYDAGALKQSDIGIAVSENTNVFTPSSDIILKASNFTKLPLYFSLAQKTRYIIYFSFAFAILYNIIGLGFAVTNHLTPIIAAILMPISSISIVGFVSLFTGRLRM